MDNFDRLVRPLNKVSVLVKGGSGPVDSQKILTGIATLMLAQAQNSFTSQSFDGKPWKPRYPNQFSPKINVAGAISDLAKGPNIKPHRFDDRPALRDTGMLKRSLSKGQAFMQMIGAFVIEVGTTLHYAGVHQWGGYSRQDITKSVVENYFAWKKREEGSLKRTEKALSKLQPFYVGYTETKGKADKTSARLTAARRYLEPKLESTSLVTHVNQRRFLGWTKELGSKVSALIVGKIGGVA